MDLDSEKVSPPQPARKQKTQCQRILWENLVLGLTLVGVGVGFAIGFGVRQYKPDAYTRSWISKYLTITAATVVVVVVSAVLVQVTRSC